MEPVEVVTQHCGQDGQGARGVAVFDPDCSPETATVVVDNVRRTIDEAGDVFIVATGRETHPDRFYRMLAALQRKGYPEVSFLTHGVQ